MEFKRIRDLREDRDKKQKEIAELLNITQQQYSLYEKGIRTIPVEYLIILSEFYNVSVDYILGLSDIATSLHTSQHAKNIANINNNNGNITLQ